MMVLWLMRRHTARHFRLKRYGNVPHEDSRAGFTPGATIRSLPNSQIMISTTGGTLPVGSLPKGATPEGIYDLSGNVKELTSSQFYPYPGGGEYKHWFKLPVLCPTLS